MQVTRNTTTSPIYMCMSAWVRKTQETVVVNAVKERKRGRRPQEMCTCAESYTKAAALCALYTLDCKAPMGRSNENGHSAHSSGNAKNAGIWC